MALWVLTDNYIISKVAKALNIAMKGRLIYMLDNTQKPLQKVISFTVPCYNSADYMDNCIQSLIDLNSGYDDIEIIIVDDGSDEDNTLEKALCWEKKYPTTVRVIHQENGGPGQAVNTGLKNAEGLYFKVVDSDDYLDKQGSAPILEYIRRQAKRVDDGAQATDMVIGNYVYNDRQASYVNVSKRYDSSFNYLQNATALSIENNWATYDHVLSDYFVQNASFIKLDNITLGYSFANLFNGGNYKGLNGRLYLTATNVATWTNYDGVDPEVGSGIDGTIYPRPFSLTMGLSLNF